MGLVVAVAVIAYAVANIAHEGAHGLACVLGGGKPVAWSAVSFDCDEAALAAVTRKWIAAAGTLMNLLLAALALGLLRGLKRTASALRYFLWLFLSVNALQAGGYWLFSGLANVGDWASVIVGRSPHAAWRVALAALGAATYLGVIRLSLKELGVFLAPHETLVAQARQLCLVPYLVGGALYVTAGGLNPLGFRLVLISAAAASLGGTSALAWMFELVRSPRWSQAQRTEPGPPPRTGWWLLGAAGFGVVFVAVLGPAVTF